MTCKFMLYANYENIKGKDVLWCYKHQAPCLDNEYPDCEDCIDAALQDLLKEYEDNIATSIDCSDDNHNTQSDPVNHPAHYNAGDIEFIDALKSAQSTEEHHGYLQGNAMKYLWRYTHKGKALEDLQKAEWYLKRLISEVRDA